MNLIFLKKRQNLLAQIYFLKENRERFARLVAERGRGERISIREKGEHADLKLSHSFRCAVSACFSAVMVAISFLSIPAPQPSEFVQKPVIAVIETVDIPETRQDVQRPVIQRPVVPLSVEGDLVPEDVTIETTELDFDRFEMAFPTVSVPVPPTVTETDLEPLEIWAVEEKPQIARQIEPEYPRVARRAGLEGTVYLKVLVSKTGAVAKAEIVRGKEIFHQAALDAIKAFEFRPAKQNDQPVDVWLMVPMQFRLTG